MDIVIREYQTEDVTAAITIWNQVLEDSEEILFLQQKPDNRIQIAVCMIQPVAFTKNVESVI